MIQLKRTTSGEISGLEYGQLGVTYNSGVAKLYVGDSSNRPVEVTTNLPKPYNLDSIKPGTNSDGLFWSDSSDTGLAGTYRWTLYSSGRFDVHSPLTRVFSDGEVVGFFESYSYIQNQDGTAKVSTQNGVKLDSQNDGIQITSTNGSVNVDAAEVAITASNGTLSLGSTDTTTIRSSNGSVNIVSENITITHPTIPGSVYISSDSNLIFMGTSLQVTHFPTTDDDVVTKNM